MDITTADPAARLLDLSRLVSRAGRPLTGVDRVEYAYLGALLASAPQLFGLVRTSLGYVLVGREGCADLHARIASGEWEPPDRFARLTRRIDPGRARAEAGLRRRALGRCLPPGLAGLLRAHLPVGTHYLNTGHSNFTGRVIGALRGLPGMRIGVLLHDTIPLDFPEFQRDDSPERFRGFLTRVGRYADLVICNSAQTEADMRRHLAPLSLSPASVVAHLGVPPPVPGTAPDGPWRGAPYFMILGTIEPRKNHALLLDIWEQEAPEAHLLICGARGWKNAAVFARLDRGIPKVHELPGLPDPAIFGLLADSAGLLFPSLAEGYGLPPVEAAALGVPALCNPLPTLREVLDDIPIYATVTERYLWATTIRRLAEDDRARHQPRQTGQTGYEPPGWAAHFKTVLTLI